MPDLTPTEIVGDALAGWVRSMGGDPGWLRPYGAARVVLDALTAAGRLLPEDGQTRTEWRVLWGDDLEFEHPVDSAEHATRFVEGMRPVGIRAAHERRQVGPWVAVDQETTDG